MKASLRNTILSNPNIECEENVIDIDEFIVIDSEE